MKILKSLAPYFYFFMVIFVVFHNTDYHIERMIEVPYVLYILLAALGFMVLQSVIKDATAAD